MQTGVLVRIFVASPGDVNEERDEVCAVIQEWNAAHSLARAVLIEPVRLETHAMTVQGAHPQDLINAQLLDRCDLLVAILWSRLGTPTNKDLSGTLQEIREFAELKGPERVLVFFCERDLPNKMDFVQAQAVRDFKEERKDKGLYLSYKEVTGFARLFRQQLELAMNTILQADEFKRLAAESQLVEETLSSEANTILALATCTDRAEIMMVSMLGGTEISAGGVDLSQMGDDRSEASWQNGIEQLEQRKFVIAAGPKRQIFRITKSGFKAADHLWRILILRDLQHHQKSADRYVDFEVLASSTLLGKNLEERFWREKLMELANSNSLDIVPVDGGIGGAMLNDMSRKLLRENSFIEFAQPRFS